VTEVVKMIAKQWQKLTKAQKQKYKEAAKRGKGEVTYGYRQGTVRVGVDRAQQGPGRYPTVQDAEEAVDGVHVLCERGKICFLTAEDQK
jgi:HMG (high mobility group) box